MERKGILKLPPSCKGGYREIKKIEIKRGLFNNFEIIKGKINKHAKLEACSTFSFADGVYHLNLRDKRRKRNLSKDAVFYKSD